MKIFFTALFFSSIIMIAGCSSVSAEETTQKNVVFDAKASSKLTVETLKAISFVYKDYPFAEVDTSCLEIYIGQADEQIIINVTSIVEPVTVGDDNEQTIYLSTPANNCAIAMTYSFDKEGEFIKKVGMR